MSALEIIQQIKALPLAEQQEVKAFLNEAAMPEEPKTRYIPANEAREMSRQILAENAELFQKLAQ
jgi:hypothetical protein